jgi:GT2 family glycosyltransferase
MLLPEVSVVVLNFNGLSDTKKCIRSLFASKYRNIKIYVVDNGSDRNELATLKEMFGSRKIVYIQNKTNLGYTGGNNAVIATLKSKYVAFVNNDVVVTPDWLSPLVRYMEAYPKVAVSQPKILWMRKKTHFDYAGACGGYLDMLGYPFTRGRIFNTLERDVGQYDQVADVFWASGAAMLVRASIFKKVGMFDTRFFNYMEEIDLCYRINKAGYRIVCVPSAHVYHKGASSSSKNELRKRFWEHRNNLLMITKNLSFKKLLYVLPIRFALEYVSIVYYLSHKRFDYALAVVLSQLSYVHLAPGVLVDRLLSRPRKQYNAERRMLNKSIVLSYFLLKKRTFSALNG